MVPVNVFTSCEAPSRVAVTDDALTTGATPRTWSASSLVAMASASSMVTSAARVEVAFWLVEVSPPPKGPPGNPPPGPPAARHRRPRSRSP